MANSFHISMADFTPPTFIYKSNHCHKVLEDLVDTFVALEWIQDKNTLRGSIHTETIVFKANAMDFAPCEKM
jgi:hypothetical protein